MNKEEQEFKELLNKLRSETKSSEYELMLREENKQLELQILHQKYEISSLNKEILKRIQESVDMRFNIEKFMTAEAISFMKLFKEQCNDEKLCEQTQIYINSFIYKLRHGLYLSNK